MIKHSLLKFLFVQNFHNKTECRIYPNIFWKSKIRFCDKKREMLSFLSLINN